MKGFLVHNQTELTTKKTECYRFNGTSYYVEHEACHHYFDKQKQSLLLIDGYLINVSLEQLFNYINNDQFEKLAQIDGHYCGLFFSEDKLLGFNDRFGARTLFWRSDIAFIISSQLAKLPIASNKYDKAGLSESLTYRWNVSEQTLLKDIKQLKPRHHINFCQQEQQQTYWQLPAPTYNSEPLTKKINNTHTYLLNSLKKAKHKFNKVAVFLSGGVDSAILAALSKEVFEHCVLITPIFKREENPELKTALAFAEKLALEHILVEVTSEQLEVDLVRLIELKRAPLRHYSSLAMMAMMRAVPEDCQAIIYGEAADTLFGSKTIKRFTTHVAWKRKIAWFPDSILQLLTFINSSKAKLLLTIKNSSYHDLVEALTSIKYSDHERKLLGTFKYSQPDKVDYDFIKNDNRAELRYLAQTKIISSDIAVHFQEAELIALLYNKAIISPFFEPDILSLSATLNDQDYYGQDFVKPILRELACQYFPRDLIYQRKYGFPVPYIAWLKHPLKKLVEKACTEDELFDGKLLNSLDIESCYETYWIAINLMLVREQLNNQITQANNNN